MIFYFIKNLFLNKKIKKLILTALSLVALCASANAQNRSIKFETDTFQEAKDKAAKENKLIFMDCYTVWCGPCKWMDKNIFTNDTVADYFNERFVCVKLDMEAGEGIEIAKKYRVESFPTLMFLDSVGNIVHRKAGAPKFAHDYTAFAETALTPEKINGAARYGALAKKYEGGDRGEAFLLSFFSETAGRGLEVNDVAEAYFATQSESQLLGRLNWDLIYKHTANNGSRAFKHLLANADAYAQKYTEDSVQSKIYKVFEDICMTTTYNISLKTADKKEYLDIRAQIVASGFKGSDKLLLNTDLFYYNAIEEWGNYAKTAVPLIDKYYGEDVFMLYAVSTMFLEKVSDKKMLAKALAWSKKGNEIHPDNPMEMDTYACLLFKTGNKKEAIEVAEKALAIAKAAGEDTAGLEKRLAEFKKR